MNRLKKILLGSIITLLATACTISYTFTGASIGADVKTFSVQTFLNVATLVAPILSSTLTEQLVNKFSRQTSLTQVRIDGDFAFEGEITNYTSSPVAITSEEFSAENRLSITIKVKFVNKLDPKANFNNSYTRFRNYPSNQALESVEQTLIPEIVSELVTDIFNDSAATW